MMIEAKARIPWAWIVTLITMVCLFTLAFAFVEPAPDLFTFPFSLVQPQAFSYDFKINQYRSYVFDIQFDYAGREDRWRVLRLLGLGTDYPGTPLTIYLNITEVGHGHAAEHRIYEGTIVTGKIRAEATKSEDGYFDREIVTINLKPGTYRVGITALDISPAFRDRPCRFDIGTNAKVRFAPQAVIPRAVGE